LHFCGNDRCRTHQEKLQANCPKNDFAPQRESKTELILQGNCREEKNGVICVGFEQYQGQNCRLDDSGL
jgi:hypothetical protein